MEIKRKPLLCVVDASSFIFRAYYAVRHLSNKEGLPTNAIFGFANMIVKVLEDLSPSHIAIVYDTKHPTFRKEKFPEYKANRTEMPDDLVPQMPYIKKFVEALGLPRFEKKGFEADDIIAALAEFSLDKKHDVCIVSSDKDLMQLVNSHIWMFDTMKNKKIDEKGVVAKMGVRPDQIADYLGLVGDSSDNIPGVKGIGPKSATGLLEKFETIEGIYENIETLKKNKQRENLENFKEQAFLSRDLATVERNVGIDFTWEELVCNPIYGAKLGELLEELEFQNLGKRLQQWLGDDFGGDALAASLAMADGAEGTEANSSPNKTEVAYSAITDMKALKAAFKKLDKSKVIALDTETTGLSHNASLIGFSFCGSNEEAFYVPVAHTAFDAQIDPESALKELSGFLKKRQVVGQNIKYDVNILRRAGLELIADQIAFDTMVASYVLDPSSRHGLDAMASKYFNHDTIKYEDVCGKGKKQITFAEVELEPATNYAAEDAWITWRLYEKLHPEIEKEEKLKKVYYEIEMPLLTVLADMEYIGIAIDKPLLKDMSKEFEKVLKGLEKKAYKIAGGEFNMASPKQLQKILFEDLGLPAIKKTKTGFSTDSEVLHKLSIQHELPAIILEYREIAKLKSTYVDVIPELANGSGRVHTSFNQTVAATGRLSSSDPNLQNIPIRTDMGKRIREAFVARKGTVLLGADYSQIELRILAALSGDAALQKAFKNGDDIHTLTASKVFEVSPEEVTPELRRQAKAVNFGLLYGKTAFSLAEDLGITRKEAAEIIENYFKQYPTIKKFLDGLAEQAREKGFAETLYGRRRIIDGINAKNKMVRNMAERMAVNTPIQGTAADLIKVAMNNLNTALAKKKLKSKILLQVHDELVLEVPKDEVKTVTDVVKDSMEGVGALKEFPKIDVPLTVEIGTGQNWLELK